jgi:hypothetical protein
VRSFEVGSQNPQQFAERVRRELGERGLGSQVDLWVEGAELVVRLRWMGTTVLRYLCREAGGGFRAELVEERVSPFHGAFRQPFEERFAEVLERLGARTA